MISLSIILINIVFKSAFLQDHVRLVKARIVISGKCHAELICIRLPTCANNPFNDLTLSTILIHVAI